MAPPDRPVREGSTRARPRLLLLVAAALLAARVGTGVWEERHPPAHAERVKWRALAAAIDESRLTRRPLLLDFTAEWCGPCKRMQSELFSDERSAQFIETHYVPVRVVDRAREDGRNSAEVDSLQQRFGVQSFPTLVAVWPDSGSHETSAGYGGVQPAMHWLGQASARLRGGITARRGGATFSFP